MVESSTKVILEVSCAELFEVVASLIVRANTFIDIKAPIELINETISRAEKFNEVLKQAHYDHWSREKFVELKGRARSENIQ